MTCAECELHKENNLDLRKQLHSAEQSMMCFCSSLTIKINANGTGKCDVCTYRDKKRALREVSEKVEINKILDIPIKCSICKNTINDGTIFYKHKIHGIVCEHCPEFEDGGVKPIKD